VGVPVSVAILRSRDKVSTITYLIVTLSYETCPDCADVLRFRLAVANHLHDVERMQNTVRYNTNAFHQHAVCYVAYGVELTTSFTAAQGLACQLLHCSLNKFLLGVQVAWSEQMQTNL
jgi:hypothetical protein